MAEINAARIATVLAANSDFEIAAPCSAALDAHSDERADAFLIEGLERVVAENSLLKVIGEKTADVVAGKAEAGLREIVGAEGEEFGALGDLVGDDAAAGDFDHCADVIFDLDAVFFHDLVGDVADDCLLVFEFGDDADAW
jgi:hypothetical protein